jgi:hypothetical protein
MSERYSFDYGCVPLSRAVLCQDCNTITAATNGHCPVCGGHAVVNVGRILNREPGEAREFVQRYIAPEFS